MLARVAILSMGLALAVAAPAMLQPALAQTTNSYTPAQRAAAEAAAKAAGYTEVKISDAQGGAIFLWAMKEGRRYYLTLTSDGKLYAGGTLIPAVKGVELRSLTAQ
jgi:hypothetical protein